MRARQTFYRAKHQLIFAGVNVALWIPIGFLVTQHSRRYGKEAMVFVVLAIVAVLFALAVHRRLVGHYALQLPSEPGPTLGEFTASIVNGALRVRNQEMQSEMPVSKLRAIEETKEAVYIFIDTNQAFFIPKKTVLSGGLNDFISELRAASTSNSS
jgi:hypothetical protein